MAILIIRFLNLLMAGLVSGVIFGIWLGYNPYHLSAATYIEQQQSAIMALNTLMPLLGFFTIILTVASAFLQRNNRSVFISLLIAAGLLVVSGLVTRFGNQPINAIVMTWNKEAPPIIWTELRDQWWNWHELRTLAAVIGFGLIIWASMCKEKVR